MFQSEFDIMRMRDHLHNCIENLELTPFPKLRRKLKLLKQTEKVLNYSIAADCAALCEFPNSYDDMAQCDTKTCQNWFHYKCMIPPNVKKSKQAEFSDSDWLTTGIVDWQPSLFLAAWGGGVLPFFF